MRRGGADCSSNNATQQGGALRWEPTAAAAAILTDVSVAAFCAGSLLMHVIDTLWPPSIPMLTACAARMKCVRIEAEVHAADARVQNCASVQAAFHSHIHYLTFIKMTTVKRAQREGVSCSHGLVVASALEGLAAGASVRSRGADQRAKGLRRAGIPWGGSSGRLDSARATGAGCLRSSVLQFVCVAQAALSCP